MTRNPILKVLSSMRANGVKCLLMGGQACVLYGAAEFSRDTDLVILAEPDNMNRLRAALDELRARCIAVPPFERKYLDMGLAVHFCCSHPDAESMRIDIMSKMRGVASFDLLWPRRTTFDVRGHAIEVMSLPDLVQAKKTQRDKDWPMLTRLVESNYFAYGADPTPKRVVFWLRELRTPELLAEVTRRFPEQAGRLACDRPLLGLVGGGPGRVVGALREEEAHERDADREYWAPLRKELERLRRERRGP